MLLRILGLNEMGENTYPSPERPRPPFFASAGGFACAVLAVRLWNGVLWRIGVGIIGNGAPGSSYVVVSGSKGAVIIWSLGMLMKDSSPVCLLPTWKDTSLSSWIFESLDAGDFWTFSVSLSCSKSSWSSLKSFSSFLMSSSFPSALPSSCVFFFVSESRL